MTNDEMMSLKVGDLVFFKGNHRLFYSSDGKQIKYGFVSSIKKVEPTKRFMVFVQYFDDPVGQPCISSDNSEFWSIAK